MISLESVAFSDNVHWGDDFGKTASVKGDRPAKSILYTGEIVIIESSKGQIAVPLSQVASMTPVERTSAEKWAQATAGETNKRGPGRPAKTESKPKAGPDKAWAPK